MTAPRPAKLKKFRPIDNFRFADALEENLEPRRDDRENIHAACPDRLFTSSASIQQMLLKLAHRPHNKEWPNSDNMRRPVQSHARSHFETASFAIHGIRRPLSKAHRLPPVAKCLSSGALLRPARKLLRHSSQE